MKLKNIFCKLRHLRFLITTINYYFPFIFKRINDEKFVKLLYLLSFNKVSDLKDPKTFSEKMQWLKLHNRRPEYTSMVDKYVAKGYVSDLLGEKYIVPTIKVWNSSDEIDLTSLPDRFVIKCTHDSGGVIICKDKSALNLGWLKKTMTNRLSRNFYWVSREWPYKDVKPRIIAEEYMENGEEGLHDYKVWCFNGEPLYVQYITGRMGNVTYEAFYDRNWKRLPFTLHNPPMKEEVTRPVGLKELLEAARMLAKGQPFLRCDFYILRDGSIKFGEMTFFPMSGLEHWKPEMYDLELGKMIDISYYNE